MVGPQPGIDYPLQLGASLLGKRTAEEAGMEGFCTLRYDFKPASAARATQGLLELSNHKVSLTMGDASFSGRYEPSKDGLDCVAVFNGTSFRLELLGACVKNLRHVSGTNRTAPGGRGPTQQPAAVVTQQAAPAAQLPRQQKQQQQQLQAGAGSLEEVASELGVASALQQAGQPAAAAAGGSGGGTAQPLAYGMSDQLEDELLKALEDGWEEEEEEEEAGAGAEAGPTAQPARRAVGEQGALGSSEAADEDEEISGSEEEEEEDDEEVEEEEDDLAAQQGTAAAAAAPQQPAAALPGVLPQLQPAPLLSAPTMHHAEMTEDERLFFGFDVIADGAASPEPPAPQADDTTTSSGGGGEGSQGGGGSEAEQEEI